MATARLTIRRQLKDMSYLAKTFQEAEAEGGPLRLAGRLELNAGCDDRIDVGNYVRLGADGLTLFKDAEHRHVRARISDGSVASIAAVALTNRDVTVTKDIAVNMKGNSIVSAVGGPTFTFSLGQVAAGDTIRVTFEGDRGLTGELRWALKVGDEVLTYTNDQVVCATAGTAVAVLTIEDRSATEPAGAGAVLKAMVKAHVGNDVSTHLCSDGFISTWEGFRLQASSDGVAMAGGKCFAQVVNGADGKVLHIGAGDVPVVEVRENGSAWVKSAEGKWVNLRKMASIMLSSYPILGVDATTGGGGPTTGEGELSGGI